MKEATVNSFGAGTGTGDFDYIARVARVNAATLWSLANAPGTPKNARILTAQLTNNTELAWDANPESDGASYEVVWRPTLEDNQLLSQT